MNHTAVVRRRSAAHAQIQTSSFAARRWLLTRVSPWQAPALANPLANETFWPALQAKTPTVQAVLCVGGGLELTSPTRQPAAANGKHRQTAATSASLPRSLPDPAAQRRSLPLAKREQKRRPSQKRLNEAREESTKTSGIEESRGSSSLKTLHSIG